MSTEAENGKKDPQSKQWEVWRDEYHPTRVFVRVGVDVVSLSPKSASELSGEIFSAGLKSSLAASLIKTGGYDIFKKAKADGNKDGDDDGQK